MQNESYISGCSAIDLEQIKKKYYSKNRRIEIELFISNQDIEINTDENGSLNILRKYNKCILNLTNKARATGFSDNPVR